MFRGLYIASTAMINKSKALEVHSNNLANAMTATYKKDFVSYESFEDILISKQDGQYKRFEGTPKITQESKDGFYNMKTSSGYFTILGENSKSYHREVKFSVDEEGYLSTYYHNSIGVIDPDRGLRVGGENGEIYVGDSEFEIDENGLLIIDGEVADNLITATNPNILGTMNSGVKIGTIFTDYTQGEFESTNKDLDFALSSYGFFLIETPAGIRYTRNGSFKLNSARELVTTEGYRVQGLTGPLVLDGENINVNKFGELAVDGELVGKFKIVNPENVQHLEKMGGSLYKETKELIDLGYQGEIYQGMTEYSNVNSVKEMIEVMEVYRSYESSQKLINSYDRTTEKAATEIGKI